MLPEPLRSLCRPWPGTCQICGTWPTATLCASCVVRFAPARLRCGACARPLTGERCLACVGAPPSPDGPTRCVVAVDYGYPWDRLMARFKFQGEAGWARPFARLMLQADGAAEALGASDWIAPIPLTPARLAERGHHPPWELTRAITRLMPRPRCADALQRIGEGPSQHSLGRAERLRNLVGAFVVPEARRKLLQGARVVLIDDVTTTGATLLAAAMALRAAGVAHVDAVVFARTPSPGEAPA